MIKDWRISKLKKRAKNLEDAITGHLRGRLLPQIIATKTETGKLSRNLYHRKGRTKANEAIHRRVQGLGRRPRRRKIEDDVDSHPDHPRLILPEHPQEVVLLHTVTATQVVHHRHLGHLVKVCL